MAEQMRIESRKGGAGHTLGTVLKVLLRLLLVIVVGTLIGGCLYFGVPWIYRTTVIPVQENTEAIAGLTQRMAQTEIQADRANDALQERTAGMEGEIVELKETVAVQSAGIATAVARVSDLEAQVVQLAAASETQADAQAELREDIDAAARDLSSLTSDLHDQQEALAALDEALTPRLDDLEARTDALALTQDDVLGRLALLQTAQDLVRVQLLLLEDNTGAARDGLQIATEHLTRCGALIPGQAAVVADLVTRVQALDALIQDRSFRTTPSLEALWVDIAALALPPLPEAGTPLAGLEISGTLTSTIGLTPTVELTPTVAATPTPPPTPRP